MNVNFGCFSQETKGIITIRELRRRDFEGTGDLNHRAVKGMFIILNKVLLRGNKRSHN